MLKAPAPGDVVVFDPSAFNPNYWNNLSETDRVTHYGALGYGAVNPHRFVFITEINQAPGHCVLVSLWDGHMETMRHTNEFRKVREDEF